MDPLELLAAGFTMALVGWVALRWLWARRPGRSARNRYTVNVEAAAAQLRRGVHAHELAELRASGAPLWRPSRRKLKAAGRKP